jgi:glycosyltransferase involved in cell wall biosynthesis
MRFLVIAPQPFFSPRGTPFSVYYRTLVTAELGHQADVLTYGQGADVDIPNVRLIRIPAFNFLGPVKTGPSALKLFLDCFMVVWTVGLLLRRRYDVVHAHEESVFWCRWLKPVFGFRMIYDMHSSLPQQLDNFKFTEIRFVHWLFEKLENAAVRKADTVITICPALQDYALTLTDDPDKILLIENSIFDPVRFAVGTATEGNRTRAVAPGDPSDSPLDEWRRRRPADQVIAYAGTLEAYQGIDKLIEAFALVNKSVPQAGLLVIGGMPQQVEEYRALAKRLGLDEQVYFAGQRPQTEAQRLIAQSGACISPRFSGTNTPLKIYHLMSTGVPLVATRIASHTQVLADDVATLTGTSIRELADGMIEVLRAPERARQKAELGRQWYETRYSRDVYMSKMQRLFELVA